MRVQNKSGWDKRGVSGILVSSSTQSIILSLFILFLLLFIQILPVAALNPASLNFSDTSINKASYPSINKMSDSKTNAVSYPSINKISDTRINTDSDSSINQVSIVILDGEEIYVQSGKFHSFYQDYRLYVKGANAEDKRIWLELCLENESLENIIATEGSSLIYKKNSTEILNVTVDTIYAGTEGVLVKFFPVSQNLDIELPRPVESDDSTPLYPITPSKPYDSGNETNKVGGFGSSLSLMVFLTVVLLTVFFTGNSRKK